METLLKEINLSTFTVSEEFKHSQLTENITIIIFIIQRLYGYSTIYNFIKLDIKTLNNVITDYISTRDVDSIFDTTKENIIVQIFFSIQILKVMCK